MKLPHKLRNTLTVCFILFNSLFLFPMMARAEDVPAVTTIVTAGGDDTSYHVPLPVAVIFDGVTYQDVYATTNSVITFGRPDNTYWDYPTTPSISIESKDWWALPNYMTDTHFVINVSEGGFQIDGAYRPYGMMTGDVTSIIVTAQIQTDGTVAYTYVTNGPLQGNERTGARLVDGSVVTLEQAGVTQVEEAPVLEPTPVSPTPEPEPVVPVVPEPEPVPVPEPQPEPQPVPEVQPVPQPVVEPVVEPEIVEPEPSPEPIVDPVPEPTPEEPVVVEPIVEETPSETPIEEPAVEESVTLDNGVVLTATQAAAVELISNPGELLATMFTDPVAAFAALAQVGADMSPEVREKSEKVVLSTVIAGGIATQAAASAAAGATYRRKP